MLIVFIHLVILQTSPYKAGNGGGHDDGGGDDSSSIETESEHGDENGVGDNAQRALDVQCTYIVHCTYSSYNVRTMYSDNVNIISHVYLLHYEKTSEM